MSPTSLAHPPSPFPSPRRIAFVAFAALSFLLLPSAARVSHAAGAGVSFGVAEDASLFADDGGRSVDASLRDLGMSQDRWVVTYSGDPSAIGNQAFLDRAVPAAQSAGVAITLSLFQTPAQTPDPTAFCQWVGNVARRYPSVHRFIIGNEVNATRFWSPQHTAADPNAGPDTYEATLAQCYDVLKGISSDNLVIGMGLAPRAVDSNSTPPLDFIRAVGAAYKASGRQDPLMDMLAVHPYPNPNASPPPAPDSAGYQNPGFYGIPQLDRVRQAVSDAFGGTKQPTTANGLKLVVDEIGYQSDESGQAGYTGSESSPTVTEAQQAAYYARVVQLYSCDPTIDSVLFFHLIDESNLNTSASSGGWQSGLEHPDGSPKPSYSAVHDAIAAGCQTPAGPTSPTGPTGPTGPTRPTGPAGSNGDASFLGLFTEAIPSASTDGPVSDYIQIPSDQKAALTNALIAQALLGFGTGGSTIFDPGALFWRTTPDVQQSVIVTLVTIALSPDGGGNVAYLKLITKLISALTSHTWSPTKDAVISSMLDSSLRDLQATRPHGVRASLFATGSARIARGNPLRLPVHRTGKLVPGAYFQILVLRPAAGHGARATILFRPAYLTATMIAQAKHTSHRG